MFDQDKCDYHLTRAQAEYAAASKAASEKTRALHLELAQLHADCARSLQDESQPKVLSFIWHREGASQRSGLIAA